MFLRSYPKMLRLEPNVEEATEQRDKNIIQSGAAEVEVPWAAEKAILFHEYRFQKKVEGLLMKLKRKNLTPKKFDILTDQIIESGLTSAPVQIVCSLIFGKAISEPEFCPIYVQLCSALNAKLPAFPSDKPGHRGLEITVKRVFCNMCLNDFKVEGAKKYRKELRKMTAREKEIKRKDEEMLPLKLRFFGNLRLIGELIMQKMFPEEIDPGKIVRHIVQELLGTDPKSCPAEENVEATCQFFGTIGKHLDDENKKYRRVNDLCFKRFKDLASHPRLSPQLAIMVDDILDLRSNNWIPRQGEPCRFLLNHDISVKACPYQEVNRKLLRFECTFCSPAASCSASPQGI